VEQLLRATAQAEARHFWFRGFRAFVTPLLQRATEGRSRARILDCGCGTGSNLALLDRFGRAYGFDLSPTGLAFGREAGRTRIARASVTAVPFPSDFFDLATSFDVLYSLSDEHEIAALREMHRIVKPGGFILVNVAAMDALRGDHSVLSRELRRYSRTMLAEHVMRAGFTVVRITYTNCSLVLPMLAARALQRRRGLRGEADAQQEIAVPPAPVNALLSGVLLAESVWLRWFDAPAGSSLLCLARKDETTENSEDSHTLG
jgi:SAM-dependent methyltransferase